MIKNTYKYIFRNQSMRVDRSLCQTIETTVVKRISLAYLLTW